MKNLLPVLLVLALLVALAVAAAVGIVLLTSGAAGREVAVALTYEIDPHSLSDGQRPDVKQMAEAVDRRLNPGLARVALVSADQQKQQIVVGVFRRNQAGVARVQRLLSVAGRLEIRRLPHPQDHRELIEQAKQEEGADLRNEAGDLLARWVPIFEQSQPSLSADASLITRRRTRDGRLQLEALVLHDDFDVDRDCLKKARSDRDHAGQACVILEFNVEGRRRLGSMIDQHQAGPATPDEEPRRLGILLDGQLRSHSDLEYYYYDGDVSQTIAGNLTPEAVDALATALNAEPLPAGLILVDTRNADR
jgi:preprotein translocase subunit SecD